MVRPSNPKLMARVLEAVTHLGEGKGSLSRDVLDFVKQNSTGPARNLTMQVRRALKHAVNAGLLRCKSGRYKMQIVLNPVKHHQAHRHEDSDSSKRPEAVHEMSDEPPVGGADFSRKVQDRKKPSRKKRAARKSRKRSSTRTNRRKVTRRRTAGMERRVRKSSTKRARRKSNNDEAEDWPTRRRRMMSKRFDDEEEEEEDEEEDDEERDDEDMRDTRKSPKMRSVNEDRYSDVSGDSASVQGRRHRSRRSKHMANESRSPSRRGDGDAEGHRKSSKRSSMRRRSQTRQRDNRRESAPDEAEEPPDGMDEDGAGNDHDNEGMELDEDQEGNTERVGTPPEHHQGAA